MRDDFLSADWADRHEAVSGSLGDLLRDVRVAFEWLVARTYDAPWKRNTRVRGDDETDPGKHILGV